jgi:hypothetical protein
LILKGGLLLSVMDARRTTKDADLLARNLDSDRRNVVAVVAEVAAIDIDDGVRFMADAARAEPIREESRYSGVRTVVPAVLGKARTTLSLGDLNTRDRDWADVWRLTSRHELAGDIVEAALRHTADYREIQSGPCPR